VSIFSANSLVFRYLRCCGGGVNEYECCIPNLHQQLDAKPHAGRRQVVERTTSARYSRLMAEGSRDTAWSRTSASRSHSLFTALEKYAATRNTRGAAQIFEVLFLWIGWANTHQLIDLAASAAAAFCWKESADCGVSSSLRHNVLRGHCGPPFHSTAFAKEV